MVRGACYFTRVISKIELDSYGETNGAINPLAAESDKRRGDGHVGYHLSKAFIDSPHNAAPD